MTRDDLEFNKFFEDGKVKTIDLGKLVPEVYDHISLAYTGEDLTSVVYRQGGSNGTIVATLTLTYEEGKLKTIART